MNPGTDFDEQTPAPPPFSVNAAIGDGWATFMDRYLMLLGASALYLVIIIATGVAASITSFFTILPIIDWAAQFLFYPFMALGLLYIGLRCARGQHADISMLFAGFGRYWPVVGINALVFVITLVLLIPGMAVSIGVGILMGTSGGGGIFGIIAFIAAVLLGFLLPMLYVLPRITFSTLVCFDPEGVSPGVTRSIGIAWRMTGRPGVHMGLIVLWFLGVVMFLVCTLLLLIPILLVAIPLGVSVAAAAYRQIAYQHWYMLRHCCRTCEYDLTHTKTGICPECGTPIPDGQLEGLV